MQVHVLRRAKNGKQKTARSLFLSFFLSVLFSSQSLYPRTHHFYPAMHPSMTSISPRVREEDVLDERDGRGGPLDVQQHHLHPFQRHRHPRPRVHPRRPGPGPRGSALASAGSASGGWGRTHTR